MAIVHEGPAPYAPVSHVLRSIEHYREKGGTLTRELLMKLGSEGAYANRTLRALRLLGLIVDEGTPTDAFKGLQRANDDEYPARLEQVIRTAYAEVFQIVDPAVDSEQAVDAAFRFYEPAAQREKMVVLFMGLCDAASIIPPEKAPRKRGRVQKAGLGTSKVRVRQVKHVRDEPPPPPTPPRGSEPSRDPAIVGVLARLPASQQWTPRERERWFRALEGAVDLLIEVVDETA